MPPPKKKTSNKASTSDIISNLPTNIIENILLHLPLRDAVKTSVLSSKWRYNWVTVPHLVFDNSFCTHYPLNRAMRKDLFMSIYQVLLLHNGPIHKFTLSIPGLESCLKINHLISFLSRNDIQDFTLWISRGEDHKLSSFLFSCLQLRHLHLRYCLFSPPTTFNGFNRLVTLEFREVDFPMNIFENFIPKCPLLEHLTLEDCTNTDNLDIDAPNLKFFYFGGFFTFICFKNTPLLASITFEATEDIVPEPGEIQPADMIKVFCCLPAIEDLVVGYNLLMSFAAGNIPDRLPATLEFLKTLVLSEICFGSLREVSCALCLIRSSPNLQKLKVELHNGGADVNAAVEFLEAQDFSDICLKKLREVEMLTFDDSKPVMAFTKLLLVKSPLLETMRIQLKREDSTTGFKILKEVTRFRRASSTAEIICSG